LHWVTEPLGKYHRSQVASPARRKFTLEGSEIGHVASTSAENLKGARRLREANRLRHYSQCLRDTPHRSDGCSLEEQEAPIQASPGQEAVIPRDASKDRGPLGRGLQLAIAATEKEEVCQHSVQPG